MIQDANTDDGFMYTIYLWLYGCTQACNYDSAANNADGSCWYAETYYDCDFVCLVDDVDGDGVCDELEIGGCTDSTMLELRFNSNR